MPHSAVLLRSWILPSAARGRLSSRGADLVVNPEFSRIQLKARRNYGLVSLSSRRGRWTVGCELDGAASTDSSKSEKTSDLDMGDRLRKQKGTESGALYKRQGQAERPAVTTMRSSGAAVADEILPSWDQPMYEPPVMPVLKQVGIITLALFLFGYHLGVINGPLDYIAADLGFEGNSMLKGLVVSICLAGAFGGSVISGMLADKLGRRRTLQLDTLPLILGPVISAMATSVEVMLLGRLLTGLGMGVACSVVPMYISEISPPSQRGTMGSLTQLMCCIGLLLVLVAGLPLGTVPGWWRTMFGFAAFPAAVLAVGLETAADSPRWLAKENRREEAEAAIERLWGRALVKKTMADYDYAHAQEAESGGEEGTWMDLFRGKVRRAVFVGTGLFVLQQLSGINGILYFSSTVFKNAGLTSAIAASAGVGAINLVGSMGATALIDRLGRQKLLVGSFLGMGVSMVVLIASMVSPSLAPFSAALAVLGTLMYVASFACGVGPVPGLLLTEIFPQRVRAKGVALAMCVHWVFNFAIGLLFLKMLEYLGAPLMYTGFSFICFLGALVSYLFVVETKGKSLEEIEALMFPTREDVEA